jgi:predicted Fe-Mo cluster-binding NifX family protein
MRVAIPLFEKDVAPRFGFADAFLVATVDAKKILSTEQIQSDGAEWSNRMEQLKDLGVNVLLCGGFNRKFLPLAENLGIRVFAGLAGDARRCMEAFAKGKKMPEVFCNGFENWGQQSGIWEDRCKGRGRKRRGSQRRNGRSQ